MSAELNSALVTLATTGYITLILLNLFILSKTFGWFNDRTITLKGDVATKLKGELTTGEAQHFLMGGFLLSLARRVQYD